MSKWRIDSCRNEADPAGPAYVLRFPSPLRRRYVAGPAFGFVELVPGRASPKVLEERYPRAMRLRDLLSALRRRTPLGRPKTREHTKSKKEDGPDAPNELPLGPTGGMVGNPERF
jgi:hypothetical protein